MPRINSAAMAAADEAGTAAAMQSKPLASLVDEIESVLVDLTKKMHANLQVVPSVQSWLDAAAPPSISPALDWSAIPAPLDSANTAMGYSTAKSEKKRAKKLQKLDMDKISARVERKRQQVESFLAVLQPILASAGHAVVKPAASTPAAWEAREEQQHCLVGHPYKPIQAQQQQQMPMHIVDFGCGTGNLLLPLAALFPTCAFTGVDMKPAALQLLQQRAAAAGLRNVNTFEGMIEQYREPFDVALALHACGNATDHVLQMAVDQRAAFVVSPCCVGKLKFSMAGGSSFHSKPILWTPSQPGDKPVAGRLKQQHQHQVEAEQSSEQQQKLAVQGDSNAQPVLEALQDVQQQQQPTGAQQLVDQPQVQQLALQHPRSAWLRSKLPEPEKHFRIMARVADIAHAPADQALLGEALAQRAAVAESCKRFVELDRCAAAAEAAYAVGLCKVLRAETMAKHHMLVGLPLSSTNAAAAEDRRVFAECCQDLVAKGLLFTASQVGW